MGFWKTVKKKANRQLSILGKWKVEKAGKKRYVSVRLILISRKNTGTYEQ